MERTPRALRQCERSRGPGGGGYGVIMPATSRRTHHEPARGVGGIDADASRVLEQNGSANERGDVVMFVEQLAHELLSSVPSDRSGGNMMRPAEHLNDEGGSA